MEALKDRGLLGMTSRKERSFGEERRSAVAQAVNTRLWRALLPGKEV